MSILEEIAAARETMENEDGRQRLAKLKRELLTAGPDSFALLEQRTPLLLLPVRLEARFAWRRPGTDERSFARPARPAIPLLIVRVYPDDVHVDDHDRFVTGTEMRLYRRFDKRCHEAMDREHFVAAWADLVTELGATRAAWVVHALRRADAEGTTVPVQDQRGQRAPVAELLPERWIGVATVDGATYSRTSGLVREPLPVGLAADTRGDDLAWMTDLTAAFDAGMALEIELPSTGGGPPTVEQLVVVGAHASRDRAHTTAAFESLLDGHHYTRGLAFTRPGGPTNAVESERPDLTATPTDDEVFEVEGDMVPLNPATTLLDDLASDGHAAVRLLDVSTRVFEHVAGADGAYLQAAESMRRLLAAAAKEPLRRLLGSSVAEEWVDRAGELLVATPGLGPMLGLRVGNQPYGVLPVIEPGAPIDDLGDAQLMSVLRSMRELVFAPAVASVPRVGGSAPDATVTLVDILRTDGVTRDLFVRSALGPVAAAQWGGEAGSDLRDALDEAASHALDLLGQLGAGGLPALADLLLDADAARVTAPFVEAPGAPTDQQAAWYLEALSFRPHTALAEFVDLVNDTRRWGAGRPRTVLFALARLALLASADRAATVLLRDAGHDPAVIAAWDGEADKPGPVPDYALADRLSLRLPDDPTVPVWLRLLSASPPSGSLPFLEALAAVRALARPPSSITGTRSPHPPAVLDVALRSELGLLSHRLDAWFTGVATRALERVRGATRQGGVAVGAWGVLLDVRPARLGSAVDPAELPDGEATEVFRDATNGGWVHAPSPAHAATAAVLRSAHLAQWRSATSNAAREAFSVDLSSRRVRRALHLLDGVREGQPVGALLGYALERSVRAAGAPEAIAVMRSAAPLVAQRLTPGGPAEAVAAANVVDGLALLALGGHGTDATFSVAVLWSRLSLAGVPSGRQQAVLDAIEAAAAEAHDALDALGDVMVAEGVFQLVGGNPVRSAGAGDAVAGVDSGLPVPGVVQAGRTGVGHLRRVTVALPANGKTPTDDTTGWAVTPRADLAPVLERWARSVLLEPGDVTVAFVDAGGASVASADLGSLQEAAASAGLAALRLAALDVVAAAGPSRSNVEARLVAMARLATGVLSVAGVASPSGLEVLWEGAAALRDLVAESRAAVPGDVPGAVRPGFSVGDADARLQAAVVEINAVTGALQAATTRDGLVAALLRAEGLGVSHALPLGPLLAPGDPAADVALLRRMAERAVADLEARVAEEAAVGTGGPGELGTGARLAARARALFGGTGWVLPVLTGAGVGQLGGLAGVAAGGLDVELSRAARVRAGVARLDRVLGVVEAVQRTVPELRLVGSADVSHVPFADQDDAAAALVVDQWTEVVPDVSETTSLAVHYDAPSSAAPNVWLLAVPRFDMEQWSTGAVVAVVEEALALARLRAVDPDALAASGAGQLLPALFSRESTRDGVAADARVLELTAPPEP